ncbi:hypothetical protein AB8A21_01290 [Streptomyces sp. BF23-18]|uniref:hypothetical protein n=1 Tax=Streptomyces sp. BF23-18 TaxID=3240282 RepID=UPI0034E59196
MPADLDIVGGAAVDVVPVAPQFHTKLKAIVLPIADRVGEEAGRRLGDAMSRHITVAIPDAITTGGRLARASATREGGQIGGALAQSVKRKLEVAFRSLPRADVRLGDTGLNADLDRLRARLQALSGKTVGLDIDAGAALAEITDIDARLARLAAENPSVQVRTDTAAARAALAEIQAQINGVDGDDVHVRVDVDTAGAMAALRGLAIALGAVAAIPVVPVAAAGIGAIASAAVAAGAGIGALALVAAPAIKGVTSAMQARTAAEQESARATDNSAASNVKASQTALQMASAQAALSSAHRQAAQAVAQANQAVTAAERSLTDAKRSARQAEDDLTQARKDAAQQLRDLNDRLLDGKLDEREATLRVQEAQEELNKVLADPTSTDLQKERAQLSYDEAVRGAEKSKKSSKELQTQVVAANKAGVDGSKEVKDAQERVRQANQKVADQERAVADARDKVRDAQVKGAEQIASAERGVDAARLSAVNTTAKTVSKTDEYRKALAKLTPEQRDLFDAIAGPKGLKIAFTDWATSMQPDVLPLITRGVDGIKRSLPGLSPLVKGAADGVGELQDAASADLKKPFWRDFKKDLDGSVKPAVVGLGKTFGHIIKGAAGVIDAFLPHIDGIADKMVKSSGKFAKWGTGLKANPAFEKFLQYSSEHGPLIADTIGKIAGSLLKVGTALSPLSGPLLTLLGGVAEAIGIVADKAPWFILLIYGIILATKLWTIAQVAFNFVMSANPLVLVGIGILALIAVVIYAYNKFSWFREGVQAVWGALQDGASAVVDWFSGPFLHFFTDTIPNAFGSVLDWVRENWPWILGALTGPIGLSVVYIVKHWDAIKRGFSDAWSAIKRTTIYPIRDFFTKTIPGWGDTLRDRMVGAFDDARKGIKTAWDKVKNIAKEPVQYVVDVVYNNGIRKVWNLVTDAFGGKHLDPLKFATGGILPGYTPGRDVHLVRSTSGPVALSGGEAIMRPEWTRAVGAGYVNAMNGAARQGGVGGVRAALGFKDGGIFDGIGDVLGGAWDKVKAGYNWLKDTFSGALKAGVQHVVNPLIDVIPGGHIGFVGLLKDATKDLALKLVGAGSEGDKRSTPHVNYKPSAGVEQWRPVVLQSLREVGQSASLANTTLRRLNQESGGNPTVVNKWDSNWQAGHPSVGLTQLIRGTFQHYAGKYLHRGPFSYGVSVDPLANVYSSMRYALAAYGSLHKAYDRPGGYATGGIVSPTLYDAGGYLPTGLNLVANGTGKPEPVFSGSQWRDIQAARSTSQRPTTVTEVHTYLGTREITDIIDQKIVTREEANADAINAGRWV